MSFYYFVSGIPGSTMRQTGAAMGCTNNMGSRTNDRTCSCSTFKHVHYTGKCRQVRKLASPYVSRLLTFVIYAVPEYLKTSARDGYLLSQVTPVRSWTHKCFLDRHWPLLPTLIPTHIAYVNTTCKPTSLQIIKNQSSYKWL